MPWTMTHVQAARELDSYARDAPDGDGVAGDQSAGSTLSTTSCMLLQPSSGGIPPISGWSTTEPDARARSMHSSGVTTFHIPDALSSSALVADDAATLSWSPVCHELYETTS